MKDLKARMADREKRAQGTEDEGNVNGNNENHGGKGVWGLQPEDGKGDKQLQANGGGKAAEEKK